MSTHNHHLSFSDISHSLRRYLESVQSGQAMEEEASSQQEAQVAKMVELVEKYSRFVERPEVSSPEPASSLRTVVSFQPAIRSQVLTQFEVLTGATGSLGAHLLQQLLDRDDVATVVCLTRGKDHGEARARVSESLLTRGLPPLDDSARVAVYAADLSQDDL